MSLYMSSTFLLAVISKAINLSKTVLFVAP